MSRDVPAPVRAPNGYLAHSPAPSRASTPSSLPHASTSRARAPVPPSPLSRFQDDSRPAFDSPLAPLAPLTPPVAPHMSPRQASQHGRSGRGDVEASCFIHSGLGKHGSPQAWARRNDHGGTAQQMTPVRPVGAHHVSSGSGTREQPTVATAVGAPATPSAKSAPASSATSPVLRETSSGYESDKSSRLEGSAILDGDLMDEEEAASSLSRQLAETAQGVREMSKELGRTRVRSKIQHVLIVTKARDNRLIKLTRELALYLMLKTPSATSTSLSHSHASGESSRSPRDRGMVVYVDAQLRASKRFDAAGLQQQYPHLFEPVARRRSSSSASVNNLSAYPSAVSVSDAGRKPRDQGQLRYWTAEMCSNSPQLFDFVVTLGGDGTVLFTSWLFQRIVPPVLPFALGSLGFLTNFDFAQYRRTMDKVVDEGIRVNLRMRFTCTVYRAIAPEEAAAKMAKGKKRKAIKRPGGEILINQVDKEGWEALEGHAGGPHDASQDQDGKMDKEIMCFSTRPVEQFEVLNDLVVDRGPSPFVSLLEVFGDEHHLTTVQADGLTVSTPTGSTAYSLSAGGSLVHPQIPALLLTPICPHTLSFRPMLLPDSMELRVCVPYNSRSTAWASFDGRGRVELKQGDHIKIAASKYPFPTVCADQQSTDWFQSISRTLRWNEREKQKSFVVVEEEHEPAANKAQSKKEAEERPKEPTVQEDEGEDEDEDEDEEDFDIDDKSGGELTPSSPRSKQAEPVAPKALASLLASHKSGVDSPDRFATPYEGPPPLSQRHLLEALAAATGSESEIKAKDNELGQRDHIRAGVADLRVDDGSHRIPAGRSIALGVTADDAVEMHTPRASLRHAKQVRHADRGQNSKRDGPKSKAFAFFGDDSASDLSDTPSE
ncbi:hypothetical protein Q5752_006852 [Cryptotrichosporon argae]